MLGVFALSSASAEDYRWHLPRGLPQPWVPADNPMSVAKVVLGQRLFFDRRMSINGTTSCASCHDPARAFTDGQARAIGATAEVLPRSAMALVNVAYNSSYGWFDETVTTLEAQMRQPMFSEDPIEMGLGGREAQVVSVLSADSELAQAFRTAFPADKKISIDNIIKAIASYERTLISGNSAFDRYVFGGEHSAISEPAKRGMALFYSARLGCANCHSGFNFSGPTRDQQHPEVSPVMAHNGVNANPMRVPTLRNIALTAPYFHDGRALNLDAVITHYEQAGQQRKADDKLGSFELTDSERRELLAFLESLTDQEFTRGHQQHEQIKTQIPACSIGNAIC